MSKNTEICCRLQMSDRGHIFTVGHSGPVRKDEFAVMLSTTPVGEWSSWQPFGCTSRRFKDARRVFLILKNTVVFRHHESLPPGEYKEGEILAVDIKSYYQEIENDTGKDICGYCGGDNGPNGEYRQGWDCCHCGGN